ncbi:MAG: hypothetical protein SGARI_001796, partial [Bacillariaceae sp.]
MSTTASAPSSLPQEDVLIPLVSQKPLYLAMTSPHGGNEEPLITDSVTQGLRNDTMDVDGPTDAASSLASSYHVPFDNTALHLGTLVALTMPWYLYTSLQMTVYNVPEDFFGLSSEIVQLMGIYVFVSQLCVYIVFFQLTRATTLRQAQQLIIIATLLCVPADVIGTLYEPNGSAGLTVLAFAGITFCFGIVMAHYLRKAAFREQPPNQHQHHEESLSILQTLQEYRPPYRGQATHMALEFTRSFVSFTISIGALGRFCAEDHEPNAWIVASLISVVVHTSLECFLTTTYPGAELEDNDSYLAFESVFYTIHMFASSIASHSEGFGDSLIDQVLFAWLF